MPVACLLLDCRKPRVVILPNLSSMLEQVVVKTKNTGIKSDENVASWQLTISPFCHIANKISKVTTLSSFIGGYLIMTMDKCFQRRGSWHHDNPRFPCQYNETTRLGSSPHNRSTVQVKRNGLSWEFIFMIQNFLRQPLTPMRTRPPRR